MLNRKILTTRIAVYEANVLPFVKFHCYPRNLALSVLLARPDPTQTTLCKDVFNSLSRGGFKLLHFIFLYKFGFYS